jgi:hypothetical protein
VIVCAQEFRDEIVALPESAEMAIPLMVVVGFSTTSVTVVRDGLGGAVRPANRSRPP